MISTKELYDIEPSELSSYLGNIMQLSAYEARTKLLKNRLRQLLKEPNWYANPLVDKVNKAIDFYNNLIDETIDFQIIEKIEGKNNDL